MQAWLDADILLYRAASFCEDEFDGEPCADLNQGIVLFDDFLQRWLKDLPEVTDYKLVFTVGRNFRKELYPEYKANRKDFKVWPGLWDLKQELLEYLASEYEDGIEADDIIGIRVTEDPENRIAVSADKDFATLPIRLYVPPSHGKAKGEWYSPSPAEADLYWFRQAMIGDTVDNYKGIHGIGDVKAARILPKEAPVGELWGATKAAFAKAGMTTDDALIMVRLARILRHGDYNWDTKEIKLWDPSTKT
jgi:DNA polymerase-1